jgi:hypothetical protein
LFSIYTPINASRKHILTECYNSEFKEGGIKFPKQAPAKPGQDKTKWCRYHRAHGHVTKECIHLKDAIEALIRQGKLGRFIREVGPRQKTRQTANVEDQISASGGQEPKKVALCISRPEDFRVPEDIEDKYSHPTFSKWEKIAETMVISAGDYNKRPSDQSKESSRSS